MRKDSTKPYRRSSRIRKRNWSAYAAGFKADTLERIFPALTKAFKDFDLTALSRMRSIDPVLRVFNHKLKANSFLRGSRGIAEEGFHSFKRRVLNDQSHALEGLPGIGPITKDHLAKNIGLEDVAKADIWLVRAATLCNASSVKELTSYLSTHFGESQHVIDVAIWKYAADGLLQKS